MSNIAGKSSGTTGLLKGVAIYSVGTFGSKVLAFLLLPLYTFFLTKKELGEFDIFISTVTLFVPLFSLQMSDAIYRWLIADQVENHKDISRLLSTSIFVMILGLLVFSAAFFIYCIFYSVSYRVYFIPLLWLNGFLPFLQNALRGIGAVKQFTINGILTSFLIVLFNALFLLVFKFKVEGIILGNILAYTVAALVIIVKQRFYKIIKFSAVDFSLGREMLGYALPLVPNLMSWWLISSGTKFIILHYLGTEANGIYAVSSRFPAILVIINSVLILPIQDAFLKNPHEVEKFKQIILKFAKLEFSLVILLSLSAPLYTYYLVEKSFYSSWIFMPFLYLGVAFNTLAALLSIVHMSEKKTLKITVSSLSGAAASMLLAWWLIPLYGLLGVSFAILVGYVIMLALRLHDLQRKLVFSKRSFAQLFLSVAVFMLLFYLSKSLGFAGQIILFLVLAMITVIINKDFVLKLLNHAKKIY